MNGRADTTSTIRTDRPGWETSLLLLLALARIDVQHVVDRAVAHDRGGEQDHRDDQDEHTPHHFELGEQAHDSQQDAKRDAYGAICTTDVAFHDDLLLFTLSKKFETIDLPYSISVLLQESSFRRRPESRQLKEPHVVG